MTIKGWRIARLGAAAVALGLAAPGMAPADVGAPLSARSTADPLDAIQARASALVRADPDRIGVAAIDITSGRMISVNGGERFPMASTVKVAIAATFLHQVQKGKLSLDQDYALPLVEQRRASRIANMQRHSGRLTGSTLLDLMLIRSDNTAADILLSAIGGTPAVGAWLRTAGVTGQRMDRSIAQLLSDHEVRTRARVGRGRHRHWITVSVPHAAPAGDLRDSSTPQAMALLLAKLRNGELLDAQRTAYLFDVMARCRTGPQRIRGLLPAGTPVAHKTGTMNGVTDDVGIVTLPDGHDVAIAVFVTGRRGVGAQDRSIAKLSRLIYEGFSTTPRMAFSGGAAHGMGAGASAP